MTVDYCKAIAGFAYDWGRPFVIAAFFLAIAETIAVLVIRFIQARKKDSATLIAEGDTKFLEALKGVLVALAGLPAWVTIYLAGLALLWIAMRAGTCP